MTQIEAVQGDITQQPVDAIVSAASTTLLGGGGVDGAIHRSAGPDLLEECRKIGGCPTGEARLTRGYRLPAKYVIHTVGPVWSGGKRREPELLRACYVNSLKLANEHGIKSVAFPSISTGAYRYPIEQAARIAVATVREALSETTSVELVRFLCFSKADLEVYRAILGERGAAARCVARAAATHAPRRSEPGTASSWAFPLPWNPPVDGGLSPRPRRHRSEASTSVALSPG